MSKEITRDELLSLVRAQLQYSDHRSYPVYAVRDEETREWRAMPFQAFESMETPRGPWIKYDERPHWDCVTDDDAEGLVDAYEAELRREIQDAEEARTEIAEEERDED
jgi:hypothetical protein